MIFVGAAESQQQTKELISLTAAQPFTISFTPWGWNKMAHILQKWSIFFLNENCYILI